MSALWPGGFLLIALAGALGALVRYLLDVWITAGQQRRRGSAQRVFPTGILLANTVACFLVGATAAWARSHGVGLELDALSGIPGLLLAALILGVGGGLSTMSTFIVAVISLWRSKHRSMAVAYLGVTVGAGLVAGLLGMLVTALIP